MKQKKIILSLFLALLISAPASSQMGVVPTMVHGSPYFAIDALSRQKGLAYQWDPLLKNAMVSASGGFVKFHVDSEFILNQNGLIKLAGKVLFFQGKVMVPVSAGQYLEEIMPVIGKAQAVALLAPTHRIRRVVIDPGHGAYDLGALSPGGIKEKELVLSVSKMIANEMRHTSVEVTMTRSDDTFIPLPERSKIADDHQADFFISIHANASPSKSLKGFEVYYLSEASDDLAVALEQTENTSSLGSAQVTGSNKNVKAIYLDLEASENRKESLLAADAIADAVQHSVDIGARRVKSAQFHVLKWTKCPSMLVEIGYLTNSEDEIKLADPRYQKLLAKAIVYGFMNYKMDFERTDGFTR